MPDYLEEVRNLGGPQSKREHDPAMVVGISPCNLDEAGVGGTSSGRRYQAQVGWTSL